MSDEESAASARISWHGLNAVVFCFMIFFAATGWLGVLLVGGSLVFWIGGTAKLNNDAAAKAKQREEIEKRIEEAEKAADLDAALVSVDAARVANDRAFAANELNNTAETARAMCGTHTAFIKATDALAAANTAYEKAVNR
ncbi:MAG: hypothetical protein WCS52_00625 [bacterium]